MGIKRVYTRPKSDLSQEQKVAFALLAFLGLGGLIFGFRSFGANLNRPIHQQIVDNFTGEEYLSSAQQQQKDRDKQKKEDTDFDGLNDYDELYVYRSSPYLKDTDSDGIEDKSEVFGGTDPNCPEGKQCGALVAGEDVGSTAKDDVAGILSVFEDPNAAMQAGAKSLTSKEDIEKYFGDITVEQIRQALLKTGMPKVQLDLIDDETLKAYYLGAMKDLKTKEAETNTIVNSEEINPTSATTGATSVPSSTTQP